MPIDLRSTDHAQRLTLREETEHLARFGAEDWPRERFLSALAGALEAPTRRGRWVLDPVAE